jgi:cytochrome o ubiquinol oxidase operon protein cyoD
VPEHLLARARHHLGGHFHHRLSDRDIAMSDRDPEPLNVAPGAPHDRLMSETLAYVIGLALALLLTGISFWVASTSALWGPGVAVGLVVLAIAQMGVHLVFFLHITTGPDNTNNVLALAFGVLIVFLVMIGTIWIMAHLAANMGPTPEMTNLMMQKG